MEKYLNELTSTKAISALIVIVIAFILWFLCRKAYRLYRKKHPDSTGGSIGATLAQVVYNILKYVIILGAFLILLQALGVNVGGIFAGLGLFSVIMGLALQEALKDIIMGLHILSDRFFSVGDAVLFNGEEGIVTAFTIRTTRIQLLDSGAVRVVCNRNIDQIVLLSHQVDIDLPLRYEEAPDRVRSVLSDAVSSIAALDGVESCRFEGTQSFEDSAVLYKIRFFCPPERRRVLYRQALTLLQDCLAANGLVIPYRQVDVHVDQTV